MRNKLPEGVILDECVYSVNQHTPEELGCVHPETLSSEAITVYYDYDGEQYQTPEERHEYACYVGDQLEALMDIMEQRGYQVVFHNDGSGNGLYYGGIIFDIVA